MFVKLYLKRTKTHEDYVEFQRYQAEKVYKDIQKYLKVPKESFVIDLGCGTGGYRDYFAEKYKEVVGVDMTEDADHVSSAEDYTSQKKADFIFCSSVIEHIEKPEALMESIRRNLKIGGSLYLSFPPFYSLFGGHKVKPFHYLPEMIAVRIAKTLGKFPRERNNYADMYGTWGLHKRTISQVKDLLHCNGFRIVEIKDRWSPIHKIDIFSVHTQFFCVREL
jgi:SAM-dependent methyltransferase